VSATAPSSTHPPQSQSVLEAVLERITYANEDTGFTIARVATERTGPDLLTVVGPLLGAQVGESLRLTGRWSSHPKYGRQFQVDSFTTVLPATIQGIRRYLGSGLIKGIGPMMAERMVAHFGTEVLTIIEQQPGRLIEVHGLGPKRTQRIADAWEEQKAIKEVMVFLSGIGVSTSLVVRIYKAYSDDSISVVRSEPFRLASEYGGSASRLPTRSPKRSGSRMTARSGSKPVCSDTLSEAADNGHCYLPEPDLIGEATKILQVDQELIGPCLDELAAEEGVVREQLPASDDPTRSTVPAVYLVPFHRAERSLAGGLLDLVNSSDERLPAFTQVDWQKALAWLRSRTSQDLVPGQQEAVKLALTSKVAVLTGGPGCGKSFTVRSIVELATAKKTTIVLVAPTGRAAKRLAELTGHEASTVHRLLELQPGGEPKYDRDNPLDADLVVVDECSMMDVILANKLIKAIPRGAHLLLVGDIDQLPSVGAGEVLRDLLAAERIPRVRLTQIFRQAQQSGIVVNAHRINRGQFPALSGYRDFYWFTCDPAEDSGLHPAEETAKLVVDIVARRIPAKFGLHPVRDVQVLTPMHRGPAGAGNLNAVLQDALTPHRDGMQEKALRRPGVPRGRQGHPAAEQLQQRQGGDLQRHRRHRHRPVTARAGRHRPHRRGRARRLRLR
jgi:exodeoxyribonuclease V alpha subunit